MTSGSPPDLPLNDLRAILEEAGEGIPDLFAAALNIHADSLSASKSDGEKDLERMILSSPP